MGLRILGLWDLWSWRSWKSGVCVGLRILGLWGLCETADPGMTEIPGIWDPSMNVRVFKVFKFPAAEGRFGQFGRSSFIPLLLPWQRLFHGLSECWRVKMICGFWLFTATNIHIITNIDSSDTLKDDVFILNTDVFDVFSVSCCPYKSLFYYFSRKLFQVIKCFSIKYLCFSPSNIESILYEGVFKVKRSERDI